MERVKKEKRDNVGIVTLDHESKLNAYGFELARGLLEALYGFADDEEIRCVLLTGRGKAFCAGGDIELLKSSFEGNRSVLRSLPSYLHATVSEIRRMKKPVITAMNGVAAGAGVGLALAADLVFAAEDASFVAAYPAIGLSPDGGFTAILVREIGYHRAMAMILRNEPILAAEARDLGLVCQVYRQEDLFSQALSIAREIADGPTIAFGATKALVGNAFFENLETQMEFEREFIIECAKSNDFRKGIMSFVNKGKPTFSGT